MIIRELLKTGIQKLKKENIEDATNIARLLLANVLKVESYINGSCSNSFGIELFPRKIQYIAHVRPLLLCMVGSCKISVGGKELRALIQHIAHVKP